MSEEMEIRVYGDDSLPTLIYLPGLHGDWTLVGSFRKALGGRVRFVEVTYPCTVEWSLEDYAAGVENALGEKGITRGWLLGESFGSQVSWSVVSRGKFDAEGVILAGGFVRHPVHWGVRLAEQVCGNLSLSLLARMIFAYEKLARFRFRHSPEVLANIQEFVRRRTEPDLQAAKHRLHLVAQNDPGPIVRQLELPVYALTGLLDPIVPWIFVRSWLRRHCAALRDYRISWHADHMVLSTTPQVSADQVLQWIKPSPARQAPT